MAVVPRIVSQRSLDPGGVVSYPTGDPVGQALEQSGNKLQQVALHYQDRVAQQERFQSLIGSDEFGASMAGEAETAKQNMKPGAMGLHDGLLETYDKRSSEWLNTIPESQRPEFAARIKAKREAFSVGAARLENDESTRYQADNIGKRLETAKAGILQAGPGEVDPFHKDIEEMINSSTLPPVQKDALRKSLKPTLEVAGFLSLPPEEQQRVAKGWGIDKGFSGTAVDRTMQLLRDKEGFRSSTYWDVNADRVGYGSDTITDASGAVRKVQRGDTVSRADAERDLQRRTAESLDSVRKSVGDEAFGRLNPNQQAALGSVTYNYGSLPASVAAAVKTGDAEAIAKSIEGLQGHNGGVNQARRLSEAALARSSGDGPVAGAYQPDARFNNVPADQRLQLAGRAEIAVNKQRATEAAAATATYNEALNKLQTGVIDGTAGMADVQKARADGWLRDAGDIMRVTNQIAARDKKLADTQAFGAAMANPQFPWNPVNKDHKDIAEAGFVSLGGDMRALQTIAEKTGIVPASAAVALQGAMFSPDAKRVEGALQTASNLVGGRYPDIFAGATGGDKLTEAANTFRHYVYDRGMSAADATKRIMEERTPEYQTKVKAKLKSDDVNEAVKKNLSVNDIRSAFDPSFLGLAPNPALTFNPEMRVRAMGDYEEIFREKFLANGDVALSKTLATEEMKRTWGVTTVNGSKTVMKYPPERSPVYAGIENAPEQIALQAVTAIKDLNGIDVDRSKIQLDEVKNTGERFMTGQAPTYVLSYVDKNGHVQTIPKQFFADPAAMRDKQTAARAAQSSKIQQRVEIDADMADLSRANFGGAVMPFLEDDTQTIDLSKRIDAPKGFAVTPGAADLEDGPAKPSWNWGAAFRRNNEMAALASSESFWQGNEPEPGFSPWDRIKGTADEVNFRQLSEARNSRKFDAIKADIAREQADRQLLDSQPWWMGLVTEGTAGILSPTTLIPGGSFVKGAQGGIAVVKAGVRVGAATAGSAALQEGMLHGIEQTRTLGESGTAIGASFFLGGLLGAGGQALLSKAEWQRAVTALEREIETPTRGLDPEDVLRAANSNEAPLRSVGAAANTATALEDNTIAGGAARATAAATAQMNPLLRALHSPSAAYREVATDLVENPLYLTKNFEGVASQPAVETLMKEYNGGLAKALQATNDAYPEYRKAGGAFGKDEFREAVGKAMRRGDVDATDPIITRVAQDYRKNVFEPLKQAAIKAGLLPADVSVDTAQSYFTRMWNSRKISADEQGFKGMVSDWVAQKAPEWQQQFDRSAERRLDPLRREIAELEMAKLRRGEELKQRSAEGGISAGGPGR